MNDKNEKKKPMSFADLITEALLEAETEKLLDEMLKPSQTKLIPKKDKPMDIKIPNTVKKLEEDKVNHPSHYTYGKYECLDVIEDILGQEGYAAYLTGNIMKYIWRRKKKNGAEDIKKARFYIDRLIKVVENE